MGAGITILQASLVTYVRNTHTYYHIRSYSLGFPYNWLVFSQTEYDFLYWVMLSKQKLCLICTAKMIVKYITPCDLPQARLVVIAYTMFALTFLASTHSDISFLQCLKIIKNQGRKLGRHQRSNFNRGYHYSSQIMTVVSPPVLNESVGLVPRH